VKKETGRGLGLAAPGEETHQARRKQSVGFKPHDCTCNLRPQTMSLRPGAALGGGT